MQGQLGHVEVLAMLGAAQAHEFGATDAKVVAAAGKVVPHHFFAEMIVPGRYRRVRGEHGIGRHRLQRGMERETALHLAPYPFQHQEGGMAFVDVIGGGLDPQLLQRAHAADAEHDLLLNACVLVAAVELVRDIAVFDAVDGQVGVEQAQADMADMRFPDLDLQHAAGQFDLDVDFAAFLAHGRMYRQIVELGIGVVGNLVAVVVDALEEVTLAVEQPDGDERQAHVGGRLAMVAGKDAEAAGIDREALVETEFGAEVGDQIARMQFELHVAPQRLAHVGVERRQHAVVAAQEDVVFRRLGQTLFVHPFQEGFRIVVDRVPQTGMQTREQCPAGAVPAIPEVVRQFGKARQATRNAWIDFNNERRTGFHDFLLFIGKWRVATRDSLDFDEMFAVILEFFDGFLDVGQRGMAVGLLEAVLQLRPPAAGQFLQRGDIQIAVMKIGFHVGQMARHEAAVLADRVAAHRRGARRHMQLHELDHPLRNFRCRQRGCFDLVDQAGFAMRALVPVVHRIEHGVGLMQHQHRAFLDQVEILVGYYQGDFQNGIGVGVQTGHFHVDPDQMSVVLRHAVKAETASIEGA